MKRLIAFIIFSTLILSLGSCTKEPDIHICHNYPVIEFESYDELYDYFIEGEPKNIVKGHLASISEDYNATYEKIHNEGNIRIPFYKGEPAKLEGLTISTPNITQFFYDYSFPEYNIFNRSISIRYLDEELISLAEKKGLKAVLKKSVYHEMKNELYFLLKTNFKSIKKSTIVLANCEVDCILLYYDKYTGPNEGLMYFIYEGMLIQTNLAREEQREEFKEIWGNISFEYYERATD